MILKNLLISTLSALTLFASDIRASDRLSPDVKTMVESTIKKCDDKLALVSNQSSLFDPLPKPKNFLNLKANNKWKADSKRLDLMKNYYVGTWSEFSSFVNDHKIPLRVMDNDHKAAETASTLIQSCGVFSDSLSTFLRWAKYEKTLMTSNDKSDMPVKPVTDKEALFYENAIQKEGNSKAKK